MEGNGQRDKKWSTRLNSQLINNFHPYLSLEEQQCKTRTNIFTLTLTDLVNFFTTQIVLHPKLLDLL